ncbi:MAG: helix-turn-helix transcriptional regulator [Candidatus Odinarchaeia archaeon]
MTVTKRSLKTISKCEEQALHLIQRSGENGIFQSELWKELGTNSREGSRISIKLEEKGLIKRKKQLKNGRWTYILYPVKSKPIKLTWNDLDGCPCFTCPDIAKCGIGQHISPITCEAQTAWLNKLVESKKTD